MEDVLERLRRALVQARKDGDRSAADALRGAMAALANAEAVPSTERASEPAAGAYGADVARRELSTAEVRAVLESQVAEREDDAARYRALGRDDVAEDLEHQVEVLRGHLVGGSPS